MMRRRMASMTTPSRLSSAATVAQRHDIPASARPMARGSDRAIAMAVAASTTTSMAIRRSFLTTRVRSPSFGGQAGFGKQLRHGEQTETAPLRLAEDARQRLDDLARVRLGIEAPAVVQEDDRAVDEPFDRAADDRIDARAVRVVDADRPGNRLAAFAPRGAVEPRVSPTEQRAGHARPRSREGVQHVR